MPLSAAEPTFMGLPLCGDPKTLQDAVAILGVPTVTPYGPTYRSHSAEGPAAMRAALVGRAGQQDHYDFDLDAPLVDATASAYADIGDLVLAPEDGAANRDAVRALIQSLRDRGCRPLVLGGDDSLPIPVIGGLAKDGPLTVVQVDAHIDWRDERHGERFGYSSPMRRASEMAHVAAMVQVGIRGAGSARRQELEDATAWGSRIVTMPVLRGGGMQAAIRSIPEGRPWFLSLDCDGLDPSVLPGVLSRAPGGLTYGDVVALMHGAARRGPFIGCAVVELCPERDPTGISSLVAARLACVAAGLMARASG